MNSNNNDDIVAVMSALQVTYEDAIDLIKNGFNVEYIKTGFKREIESDVSMITNEYRKIFEEIAKDI